MKKKILFLLITVLCLDCYSQITFENGYYINNTNQKIECLIKNIDWKNNPSKFEYKFSENGESQIGTLKTVKEFGIEDSWKYVRSLVNIDRSSENINELGYNRDAVFQEEMLFLKVLVEGKFSLYEYLDQNLKRYFYTKDNSNIEQLIFKSYKTTDNKIGKNNQFKQQLWANARCPGFDLNKMESLDYRKNELVNFFVESNKCHDQDFVDYTRKQKRDFFNLTLRPRLKSSSLSVEKLTSNYGSLDFDNQFGLGFGIEAEFILPFNKNKWAITIEPTYQSFKSEKSKSVNYISGGEIIANADYSSIEVPIGLRYNIFLNQNSRFFINTSYLIDLPIKSSLEYYRVEGGIIHSFEIESGSNLAFGLGYKLKNKYNLEARYQTNRQLLGNKNSDWSAEYSTPISIMIGYSPF